MLVAMRYNPPISEDEYPKILQREMDKAFFSKISLVRRYTTKRNSAMAKIFTRWNIPPMDTINWSDILVMSAWVMVEYTLSGARSSNGTLLK